MKTDNTMTIDPAHDDRHFDDGPLELPPRGMSWSTLEANHGQTLLDREWLATNGLGGYASGTVSGACTRRYHGLLIAALPAPLGRVVMFNHLGEEVKFSDRKILRLDSDEPLNEGA